MLTGSELDEVWFVVSPQNPLKERSSLLADHHRLQMVRVAIEDNYRMRACDVEFHLPIPSYTVVTLAHLGELYPEREFCLIMGSDNLDNFFGPIIRVTNDSTNSMLYVKVVAFY